MAEYDGVPRMPSRPPLASPTLGSYGYAVKCLAEGLDLAVEAGFISEREGRREFRSQVATIQESKDRDRRRAELMEELDALDEAETEDD